MTEDTTVLSDKVTFWINSNHGVCVVSDFGSLWIVTIGGVTAQGATQAEAYEKAETLWKIKKAMTE